MEIQQTKPLVTQLPLQNTGTDSRAVPNNGTGKIAVSAPSVSLEPKVPSNPQVQKEIPEVALEDAARAFNTLVEEISSRGISFTKDEGSGRTIIQVVDKVTGDIIRQVPPQEYLDMVQKLNKAAEVLLKDLPRYI